MTYLLAALAAAMILSKPVTAQIIPARIQEEIAVCRTISRTKSWKRRDFFELLERRITLARPRVNQRQSGNSAQAGVTRYDAGLHVTDLGPVMMTRDCGDYDSRIHVEAARRRCSKQMTTAQLLSAFPGFVERELGRAGEIFDSDTAAEQNSAASRLRDGDQNR